MKRRPTGPIPFPVKPKPKTAPGHRTYIDYSSYPENPPPPAPRGRAPRHPRAAAAYPNLNDYPAPLARILARRAIPFR
jgi:hypothetical protein